jgi:hypothetical protein
MIKASDRAVPAALVADILDATAAAVLRVAGVDDETGRGRIERVRLHADLTILARLALALLSARAVPLAA